MAIQDKTQLILLIEDDNGFAALVQESLGSLGWHIVHIRTGQETLLWLANNHPQLILLDYSLPDLTGAELVEQIRTGFVLSEADWPVLSEIQGLGGMPPFIVITGAGDERIAVTMMKYGARDYLIKDRNFINQLPRVVERALREIATERNLVATQEALSASEGKFITLVENLPDVIMRFDREFRHLFVNHEVEKIVPLKASEFIGKTHRQLGFPPELAEFWETCIQEVFDSGKSINRQFEFPGLTSNTGQDPALKHGPFIFEWRLVPEFNEKGQVQTVLSISRDITEQVRAEAGQRKSEERLKNLIESMEDLIFLQDVEARYLYYNGSSKYGVTPDDLIGKTPFDMFDHENAVNLVNTVKNVAGSGKPLWRENKVEWHGETLWFSDILSPVYDKSGQIIAVSTISRNITARKQAEAMLKESEEQFRRMFEEHSAVMFLIDPETGKLVITNHAAEKYYGYPAEHLREMFIYQINQANKDDISIALQNAAGEQRNYFEFRHLLANGEIRNVEVHSSPIPFKGKKLLFSIVHDITDRKQAEEQIKALLQEKELLLKEVHHRIKNNLATMMNLLQLQAMRQEDATTVAVLEDAARRLKSMSVLYEKLYESKHLMDMSLKVYLLPLIVKIMEQFPTYRTVKVETQIVDFMLKVQILTPLGILINELITNIMKYAFIDRSEGTITVATTVQEIEHAERQRRMITLLIADNGQGMPENIGFGTSTGFGLYLVELLTKQIGGTVRIERNQGTQFILEFEAK